MKIDILTLFPEMFTGPFDASIIKRAKEQGLIKINIHNLRDWGLGKHKQVDDRPYGGGVGMILMPQPIYDALQSLKIKAGSKNSKIILLNPQGKLFNQKMALKLSTMKQIILICGHYEGFDERIRNFVDEEISIGDYVLTGGEIPAMVIVDTVTRLIPGVLEKPEATKNESFSEKLLDYPQYTRPENFKGLKVPRVLLSGNHAKIQKWRQEKAIEKTKKRRPDIFKEEKQKASY